MTKKEAIKLFEEKKVRTIWYDEQDKWYFSVLDVISALTDSANPTDYFKKVRKRDEQLAAFVGTNCPQVLMMNDSGKRRKTLVSNATTIFRIIQLNILFVTLRQNFQRHQLCVKRRKTSVKKITMLCVRKSRV